jgi:RNA polymerase subunit RPABC4/transcription elongation factor Spt4
MKSPTDELLDLCPELDAEPPRSGFTGGLDLYDELIHFAVPSSDEPPPMSEPPSVKPTADSGPLSQTGDVIRITGPLAGLVASRTAMVVCGDCGNSTNSSEMFCNHCGGLLDAATASAEAAFTLASLCDDCGAVVESDEIFCPSCGSVMANA